MSEEIVDFIIAYGYLAIFILVFLQETGMPNPVPNELVLLFSGYLSFKGILYLPFIILTVISADFIGTIILYFIFYLTGTQLLQKKPKWIPFPTDLVNRLTGKISNGTQLNIFIFRLTPFTRGYTSVITGLLQIRPAVFLPIALVSAATWASFYVIIGNYIGPSWNLLTNNIAMFKYIMLAVLGATICTFIIIHIVKRVKKLKDNQVINDQ